MKPTRIFATASLIISSVALITAASISVGDETGVVRMAAFSPQDGTAPPAPTPDPMGSTGVATMNSPQPAPELYPQPGNYAPYFERSFAVTEAVPNVFYQPAQPFGPIVMFETNINDGLGYQEGYQRINARVPYHIIPNTNVLIGDLSANVTFDGLPVANGGLVYRRYDDLRNRIFGVNAFLDYDQGIGNMDWYRGTVGFESLGRYMDFRANGYFMLGDDSLLLSNTPLGVLGFAGNNAFTQNSLVSDNAYSGFDVETGGPVPLLGQYGQNLYGGAYYLTNDNGGDTVGFQARWEALITQNLTVNTRLTTDDKFGTNTTVSLQYEIPNYKDRRTLRPRSNVRERLMDPVYRHNRVQTNTDTVVTQSLLINNGEDFNGNGILDPGEDIDCDGLLFTGTGLAYNLMYVDPNATDAGIGTFENPFSSLQSAALANNANFDIIRVTPRADDLGTNLSAAGGFTLFDNQVFLASTSAYNLGAPGTIDRLIPATATNTNFGPLISNSTMVAGQSVINLANNNNIVGFRINAANAAGTAFGNGLSNAAPISNVYLNDNIISNYSIGANLQDVSGRVVVSGNQFNGLAGTSVDGLNLSAAGGSSMDLLIDGNTAINNSGSGYSVIAKAGSTINAHNPDDPDCPTGIVNNSAANGGTGIFTEAQAGATFNAVVEGNTSNGNTADGFAARADGGTYNLASLANNTFNNNQSNGAFIHYLNGGVFNSVSEDANGNGELDPGEDLNGNGGLDQGIVSNTMSGNSIAGLCIFGEDASTGRFDIGGPTAALGNTFVGNLNAGIAVDLRDSATAQMDTLNNLISSTPTQNTAPTLTFVLDFVEAGQNINDPFFGLGNMLPFDVTGFGFAATDYDTVTNAVLATVRDTFYSIPTTGVDNRSPMPDGQQLDVNFVIGDLGSAPTIGATEYYTTVIGGTTTSSGGVTGVAWFESVRNAAGNGPNLGFTNGGHVASVFSDTINSIGGLTPADIIMRDEPAGQHIEYANGNGNTALNDALTSGNLTFTRNALAGTIAHEIGHTLSLTHMNVAGSVTPTGAAPVMGTGAIDLQNQARISQREFGYSGFDGENGNAPIFHVQQLIGALGTRDAAVAGVSGDGIRVNAVDNARLLSSTYINNTITNNSGDGLAIAVSNNAVAEGVTIQGNTITGNSGRGVDLTADGPNAFIDADGTIGGSGVNVLGGSTFSQGNTISNNQSDGIRALAANGATIHGNAINNLIGQNAGNGIALQIDNGGEIDFGTTASNRVIRGNAITGNGGAGIQLTSNVSATREALMRATVLGNTISNNVSGGIVATQSGTNNTPPAPPAVQNNNQMFLVVGGANATDANTINANGDAGIAVNATGNSFANVALNNVTVTNTVNGADPNLNGDGINLRRADSALLTASLNTVVSTGNAGDGLHVETSGSDKTDPNQPILNTPNTVTVVDSNFSNNTQNGAHFVTRGDSTLIADVTGSTFRQNTLNGIHVQTFNNSSFGDPTIGIPPGRRSVFDGLFVEGNGVDGIQITAANNSRALVEVTSNAVPGSTSPHAAATTLGASSISNNGRDGIRITTTGGGSDILITSGTATTTIDGNGTVAGGNGIRWDASGNSDGVVRVTKTTITNSIRGTSELAAITGNGILDPGEDINGNFILDPGEDINGNGNGVLDPGEDINRNGFLDPGEDTNSNQDIDVADGDGIQANFFDDSTATLIIGNTGEGNTIQDNQDDGIAITATGKDFTFLANDFDGNPRPIIAINDNIIGGTRDGIAAGNGGDGVSLNVMGGTDVGFATDEVDFTLPGLTFNGGVTESGAIPQFTMSNNMVSNNGRRGANLLLTGAAGRRVREGGASIFDPVRITLDNNTIASNGAEGVFYRADSDMNQSRFVYLANFPDPPIPGNDNQNFSPFRPEFFNLNVGSVNGNTAYLPLYLNLRTVQNSLFTATNNTIQNNGTGTVTGEGIRIEVGTGSYVAADIRDNTLGGNLQEDLVTSSFLSAGNTFDSNDTSGDLTFDYIYLDDTAQMDMRFQNNTGNQIAPSDFGAVYTNVDPLKAQFFFGSPAFQFRFASLFQVDNGPNLNNPSNSFTTFGVTQDIQAAFTNGDYNLRGAADPAFPNIGFAPFLP